MPLRTLLVALLLVSACDSSDSGGSDTVDPTDPTGRFTIESTWFRLTRVVEPSVGGVEDLQAWIDGSITMTRTGNELGGSGSCTIRRRRHRAWIPQTTDETATLPFSAAGTLDGDSVTLTLQGCAWAMARYTGTFSEGTYSLRVGDRQSAPAWDPDIWSSSTQLDGDDPRDLVLTR